MTRHDDPHGEITFELSPKTQHNLKNANEPFVSEEELVSGLKATCHDGLFRLFVGATFETWRVQGEQGTVDHLTRLKAFDALRSAFTTLTEDEWKDGITNSPHGASIDKDGNLIVSEWSAFGHLHKFVLSK